MKKTEFLPSVVGFIAELDKVTLTLGQKVKTKKIAHLEEQAKKDYVENIEKIVEAYNKAQDISEREGLMEKLMNELTPKSRQPFVKSNLFEIDSKGNLYLTGSSKIIPKKLAGKFISVVENAVNPEKALSGLVLFWKRLMLNPDPHVVEQLYAFISHNDIAITSRGYILGVKSVKALGGFDKETGKRKVEYSEEDGTVIPFEVNSDMKFAPHHRGSHGMNIKLGQEVSMPREECNSDPNETCAAGLHVGAWGYVGGSDFSSDGFGGGSPDKVILEVLVCPSQVVSVPYDYNGQKMRCCMYYPISIANGENKKVFREEDFDNVSKKHIEAQFEERRAKIEGEVIKLQEQIDEETAILDKLY